MLQSDEAARFDPLIANPGRSSSSTGFGDWEDVVPQETTSTEPEHGLADVQNSRYSILEDIRGKDPWNYSVPESQLFEKKSHDLVHHQSSIFQMAVKEELKDEIDKETVKFTRRIISKSKRKRSIDDN
jgi:hypothetical protein